MTDNEIIKALECCCDAQIECDEDCPLFNYDGPCWDAMRFTVLSIINRQKAEIERLSRVIQTTAECAYESRQMAMKWARAEAIKGFAERLKNDIEERY